MRVSTAFNRLLQVPGASVTAVCFVRGGGVGAPRRGGRPPRWPRCGCGRPAGVGRRRLRDLYLIGVDEVSYRRGQRYLTLVADHADGAVVWAGKGRGAATLERFFAQLGEQETAKLRAVSIDMAGGYQKAIRARAA